MTDDTARGASEIVLDQTEDGRKRLDSDLANVSPQISPFVAGLSFCALAR
jgi:hypothetical protein